LNMKKFSLILLLAFGAFVLSACTGAPLTNNWPGLSTDGERAYLSTGSFVYAVDLETGDEVWRYPEEANGKLLYYSSPVVTPDNQLLIGSAGTTHYLVSLDPETGREVWAKPFSAKGAWVASPLVFNDRIYAPNTNGFIYVLDMDGEQADSPIAIGGALWSAPTPSVDGTLLYVTSLDHHLHVIDPAANAVKETVDLGGAVPSSPLATDQGAYVGSFASKIDLVKSSGEHEVVVEAADWVWGTPAIDGETLYYADLQGNIFSFDLASGRQNWEEVQPDGPIVARLLIQGDQIYVATEDGTFIALDRDAQVLWEKEPGGKIYTSPVAAGELILVAPYQAEFALAAYDAEGKRAWTFTPEN
jgi:outer membrane protein assembly factor BamB